MLRGRSTSSASSWGVSPAPRPRRGISERHADEGYRSIDRLPGAVSSTWHALSRLVPRAAWLVCTDPLQTRCRWSRWRGSVMPLSTWTWVLQVWASGRETGGWKDHNFPDATWNVRFFSHGTVTRYTKTLLQMKIDST